MMVCAQCQEKGEGRFCGSCGGVMSAAVAGNAFTWPFYQHAWSQSLWMPMIWGVPLIGNSLAFGWSIEAIRRRTLREANPLPQFEDGASILVRGFVVFCFTILYFVIPLAVMAWLLGWGWLIPIWQFGGLLWRSLMGQAHESVASFLLRNAFAFFTDAATPILYVALTAPIFLVARVRYALTGSITSFFRIFGNACFCLRHIGDVLFYFLRAYLLRAALGFATVFLLPLPLIGQWLPYAFLGLSTWANAFWAGQIASLLLQERRNTSTV